ncbi:MAG TPA: GNA1162 family protein [Anaeromyxobacteraceae bacterium]|nr:GNA1162 family protein [Anaeromyxobacteraceae bacterium]
MPSIQDPRRLPAAALLATLAACASGGGSGARYQDAAMDFAAVRTVAVMPFQNLTRENTAAERVRDVFATTLLATGAMYVVPQGEVQRAIAKGAIQSPTALATEDVIKLGQALKADALITGVVREYGEIRAGAASSNVVALSLQMVETATGKVVWSASSTKGGVSLGDRLLGAGGAPMNQVTEAAVDDLLEKLFR